jgi:hypothetical protein
MITARGLHNIKTHGSLDRAGLRRNMRRELFVETIWATGTAR